MFGPMIVQGPFRWKHCLECWATAHANSGAATNDKYDNYYSVPIRC